MTEYLTAWQCVSCGKVDGPQSCAGACQFKKLEMVSAAEYETKCAQLAATQAQLADIITLLRQLAHTRPRDGQWQRAYGEAQAHAMHVVVSHDKTRLVS
jgi:hypothetical protein